MVTMNEEQKQIFFQNWHNQWIQPELDKRFGESGIPKDFRLRECLIMLPLGRQPIVRFNDECEWELEIKLPDDRGMKKGEAIYTHDVVDIQRVIPPQIEGKRVAFMYLFWTGQERRLLVDFTPNDSTFDSESEFKLGETIAWHLKRKIIEIVVKLSNNQQANLRKIGLWTATALLPYPLSRIIERLGESKIEEARGLLVEYCNSDFVTQLVDTWWQVDVFEQRRNVFEEAVFGHSHGMYRLSIYALIPQIEGIITDWLHIIGSSSAIKWRTESKIEQFRDLVSTMPRFDYMFREALKSVSAFLLDGPPLQKFTNWLDAIDGTFPNRHVVAHGKYEEDIFTEENSIKSFLLLDTICQFILMYEATHENATQNHSLTNDNTE